MFYTGYVLLWNIFLKWENLVKTEYINIQLGDSAQKCGKIMKHLVVYLSVEISFNFISLINLQLLYTLCMSIIHNDISNYAQIFKRSYFKNTILIY